jgi:PIN domain nuclease of toxin-antitoxin system
MGIMRVLIDTHVLIWVVFSPEKLSSDAIKAFESSENEIFLSPISLWEIGIKFSLGKLDLGSFKPETLLTKVKETYNFKILDVSIEDTSRIHHLKANHHRDPFDRMLIWQALSHNLTFITNDANIQKYQDIGLRVVW